jgi:hypothetical protein
MSPQAMSPLRRRMIEDRTIRQFGDKTKSDSAAGPRPPSGRLAQFP